MELGRPVEGEAGVVLLGDVRGVLDPEPVHDVALDVHAQDGLGVLADLGGVVGQLDAAGLAPAADLHLRLDHDRVAGGFGLGDGLVDGVGHAAGRRGDAEAGEVLLALVLVEIHRCPLLCSNRTLSLRPFPAGPSRAGPSRPGPSRPGASRPGLVGMAMAPPAMTLPSTVTATTPRATCPGPGSPGRLPRQPLALGRPTSATAAVRSDPERLLAAVERLGQPLADRRQRRPRGEDVRPPPAPSARDVALGDDPAHDHEHVGATLGRQERR